MQKIIFLFLILGILFISGCNQNCESELYTSDGQCCTYVCDTDCDNGYKEGTCNCECEEMPGLDTGDTNINSIFEDATDIEPPSIPI